MMQDSSAQLPRLPAHPPTRPPARLHPPLSLHLSQYGWCCTPCLFGDNAERMGDGSCPLNCCLYYLLCGLCCGCCLAGPKRARLRTAHNLREEPCGDCCVHCWCPACAICQEAR